MVRVSLVVEVSWQGPPVGLSAQARRSVDVPYCALRRARASEPVMEHLLKQEYVTVLLHQSTENICSTSTLGSASSGEEVQRSIPVRARTLSGGCTLTPEVYGDRCGFIGIWPPLLWQ